jgi:C-terminal peptidase prc
MNKLLRFLSAILVLVMIAPSVLAYDDVPSESPYFYSIEYLRRNDVFQDTKLFKPDSAVTRAEYIVYLTKLNMEKGDLAKAKKKLPYSDTVENGWYAPYLRLAIQLGILTGEENSIRPYARITLLEALELLFHSRSIPIPKKYVGEVPYKDLKRNLAVQALVMRAMELGIVQPEKPDQFGLYRRVTRAEAALMIYKMDLVDLREPQKVDSITEDLPFEKLKAAWNLIRANYVDKDNVDFNGLSEAAMKAMADKLGDPYSTYLDVDQNTAMSDELGGQFEGIGAYIEMKDNKDIAIVAPIKDSPAFKAGVKSGDIVRKVDDFDAKGATLQEVVSKIKGPKGTKVKLTLERNGLPVIIEVKRDVVTIKAVESEVIGNGKVMRINLSTFSQSAAEEFGKVVQVIQANPEIKGIIIDLRDDPGGLLDAAVGVLNYLLPNQSPAVTIQYSYFNYTQYTTGQGELSLYPMVVLINKGSASASEIVAGALKDYGVATVVGEKSFGKGTVQEINYFVDGSSLKLTVAKWLTPKGVSIQKNGIEPDIAVAPGTNGQDPMLEKGLSVLSSKIR